MPLAFVTQYGPFAPTNAWPLLIPILRMFATRVPPEWSSVTVCEAPFSIAKPALT